MKNELYNGYKMFALYTLRQLETLFAEEERHEELDQVREAISFRTKYKLT